ncbi:MAG: hypothetical protein ACR2QC_01820 [Gammaproteobacteria bacterium]
MAVVIILTSAAISVAAEASVFASCRRYTFAFRCKSALISGFSMGSNADSAIVSASARSSMDADSAFAAFADESLIFSRNSEKKVSPHSSTSERNNSAKMFLSPRKVLPA